jgi:hypothetical protein
VGARLKATTLHVALISPLVAQMAIVFFPQKIDDELRCCLNELKSALATGELLRNRMVAVPGFPTCREGITPSAPGVIELLFAALVVMFSLALALTPSSIEIGPFGLGLENVA